MPKTTLFKQDGSQVGEVELNETIFGMEPNEALIFEAVVMSRASLRQGTHAVKNRSAVRGGGRKPWRQKGTGRARQGSIRSPQWVGGGVVFGPTPRSYGFKMPRKQRRLAINSALSQKAAEGDILVLESLQFDTPKTKEFKTVLENLDINQKVLVVLEGSNNNAYLSARNLPNVKVIDDQNINVLDVVSYDRIMITKDALSTVEEALA